MSTTELVLSHAILLGAQPVYFGTRLFFNPNYFHQTSITWLTLAAIAWIFILTRATIPAFTSPLRRLPTPKTGRFPWAHTGMMRDRQPPDELYKAALSIPNDGMVAMWDLFYLRVRLIPTRPETVMEIVNTNNYDWEKPGPAKKILRNVLGEGLVNVEGNTHKAMRRAVAPAFSGKHIRDLVPLFWSKGLAFSNAILRELKASPDGEVEIAAQMSRVTLDIIGSAGVGFDFNTIENADNKLARLYSIITNPKRGSIILFVLINVFLPPWFVRSLRGTIYQKIANATVELRATIRELLHEKKQAMKLNSADHKDIISIIMRSGDFSDDYLCDQLLTYLAAGHETTASALSWAVWFLSENQEMQDRLRQECRQHLGGVPEDQVTADVIDTMPYLAAVCNETLRLYPTVTVTARQAITDTTVSGVHIPKGTFSMIAPWILNRDPQFWGKDALSFRPERWVEDTGNSFVPTGGAKSLHSFLTFLHGPRSCIGQGFARMEMKCLLAALVLKFRFDPSLSGEEIKIGGFIAIKPMNGLKLRITHLADEFES